jgi:hypothetical protein
MPVAGVAGVDVDPDLLDSFNFFKLSAYVVRRAAKFCHCIENVQSVGLDSISGWLAYIGFGPAQNGVPIPQFSLVLPDLLHYLYIMRVGHVASFQRRGCRCLGNTGPGVIG